MIPARGRVRAGHGALVLLAALALGATPVAAANPRPFRIGLAVAAYPGDGDSAWVEIHAALPATRPEAGGPWLLTLWVEQEAGEVVLEESRVDSLFGAGSVYFRRIRAGSGRLRVRFRAEDMDSGRSGDVERRFEVLEDRGEGLEVSTLLLGVIPREPGPNPGGVPGRHGLRPWDLPGEPAEGDTLGLLFTLAAPGAPAVPAAPTHVKVVWRRESRVEGDTSFVLLPTETEVILRRPAADLAGGAYQVLVVVDLGTGTISRSLEFRLPPRELDFLEDVVRARTVLGYVATREERLALETAARDSLEGIWSRFWKRRDPTPDTGKNEARELFMQRVGEAERRFGGVVPGWRTDQGRIFIRHGPPDRIDRSTRSGDRPETETWYYDNRSLPYVFQDAEGFGTFRLTGGLRD